MRLDKGWRIVRRFAFVFFTGGFAIGIFAALAARSNAQGLLMILAPACPAMWFPPHVSWAEAPVWLLFTVIPIVNSVLYAVGGAIVGALVVGLTSKPK